MIVKSLTSITDDDLLKEIEKDNDLSGTPHDLKIKIATIKGYLRSAGVADAVLGSTLAIGCISRGVMDIWNYGNGDTKPSPFFYELAEQLRNIEVMNEQKE